MGKQINFSIGICRDETKEKLIETVTNNFKERLEIYLDKKKCGRDKAGQNRTTSITGQIYIEYD